MSIFRGYLFEIEVNLINYLVVLRFKLRGTNLQKKKMGQFKFQMLNGYLWAKFIW